MNMAGTFYVGDDDDFEDFDGEVSGDQIVGLDDIIGDDDDLAEVFSGDMYVGADTTAMLKNKVAQLTRALKGVQVGNKKIIRDPVKVMRVQVLPLPVTAVVHGTTEDIEASPQRPMRVERLIVPSFVARYFTITNFSVGQDPQFIAAGEVSAQTYSEVAVGTRLQGNTANVGNRINLSIKNIDAADQTFYGSISGTVLTNG
jgi:hypothetical protein